MQEIFVLLTFQAPQEGICRPKKKSPGLQNFAFGQLDQHCSADLDFFERPGLVCMWNLFRF